MMSDAMDRNPRSDREMRELLIYLRDTFSDAATRIDSYLARSDEGTRPAAPREARPERRDERRDDRWRQEPTARREWTAAPGGAVAPGVTRDEAVRSNLERIREEVRHVSDAAPSMDPARLRLTVEALTAETRILQARAHDPEDGDIAAKIMRALTAIVSEHRPGHVYGLARHHQADWEDLARRARAQMASEGHDGSALDG
jgi:hypothetical protein